MGFFRKKVKSEESKIWSANYATKSINDFKESFIGRREYLLNVIENLPENAKFLDVGCGAGPFLKALAEIANNEFPEKNIKFYGIDITEEMIDAAREYNGDNGVTFAVGGDINSLKSLKKAMVKLGLNPKKDKFDYVSLKNVLFFIEDEKKPQVLQNLKNILSDEGDISIRIREKDDKAYEKFKPGNANFKDLSKEKFHKLMEEAGFENVNVEVEDNRTFYAGRNDEKNKFKPMQATGKNNRVRTKPSSGFFPKMFKRLAPQSKTLS